MAGAIYPGLHYHFYLTRVEPVRCNPSRIDFDNITVPSLRSSGCDIYISLLKIRLSLIRPLIGGVDGDW